MSEPEDIRSYQMRNFLTAILVIIYSASLIQTAHAASSSDGIYQAHKKLKELGYDPGPSDGIWGKKTTDK